MKKTTMMMMMSGLMMGTSAIAGPIITPCAGSWDGPGRTACEIKGREGIADVYMNFSSFEWDGSVLWEITARDQGNGFRIEPNGSLTYWNQYDTFNSYHSPLQFAYWVDDERTVTVGVEDLTHNHNGGSDYDYNDYGVQLVRRPIPQPVPETGSLTMFLMGIAGMVMGKIFKK